MKISSSWLMLTGTAGRANRKRLVHKRSVQIPLQGLCAGEGQRRCKILEELMEWETVSSRANPDIIRSWNLGKPPKSLCCLVRGWSTREVDVFHHCIPHPSTYFEVVQNLANERCIHVRFCVPRDVHLRRNLRSQSLVVIVFDEVRWFDGHITSVFIILL